LESNYLYSIGERNSSAITVCGTVALRLVESYPMR
jgi:hypothetical protein